MPWASSTRKSRLPADWPTIHRRILKRDGYVCQIHYDCCIVKATDCDHIIAGDDHRDEALQAACRPCHNRKSSAEGHMSKPKRRRPVERHPGLR